MAGARDERLIIPHNKRAHPANCFQKNGEAMAITLVVRRCLLRIGGSILGFACSISQSWNLPGRLIYVPGQADRRMRFSWCETPCIAGLFCYIWGES